MAREQHQHSDIKAGLERCFKREGVEMAQIPSGAAKENLAKARRGLGCGFDGNL